MKTLNDYINEALRRSRSDHIDKSNCLYDKHINEWKYKNGDNISNDILPKIEINSISDFAKKYMLTKYNTLHHEENQQFFYLNEKICNLIEKRLENKINDFFKLLKTQYDELHYPFEFKLRTVTHGKSLFEIEIENSSETNANNSCIAYIAISLERKYIEMFGKSIPSIQDLLMMFDNIIEGKV